MGHGALWGHRGGSRGLIQSLTPVPRSGAAEAQRRDPQTRVSLVRRRVQRQGGLLEGLVPRMCAPSSYKEGDDDDEDEEAEKDAHNDGDGA